MSSTWNESISINPRRVREAFIKKKKKKMTFVYLGGGVKKIQNVIFFKVVFKIHFKPF